MKTKQQEIPTIISIRTKTHAKELRRWRRSRRGVPWGVLLRDALDVFFNKERAA